MASKSNQQGWAIAETSNDLAVSGVRIRTLVLCTYSLATTVCDRRNLVNDKVKLPDALLEQLNSWRYAQTTKNTNAVLPSQLLQPTWGTAFVEFFGIIPIKLASADFVELPSPYHLQ